MRQDLDRTAVTSRAARPSLRPFIRTLWASRPDSSRRRERLLERVLPTGRTHLVFRMSDEPLRLSAELDGPELSTLRHAMVGGPRSAFHLRDITTPAPAFGADFHPGAAELFLGIPADELAGRHTSLEALWGREAHRIRERLAGARTPEDGLGLLEELLEARLAKSRGQNPVVVHALRRFEEGAGIAEVVEQTGYSHRRFIELFRRSVGLSPKLYSRMLRFQRALAELDPARFAGLGEAALAAGYSDQAHFNREFREFSGLSPGAYRALGPAWSHHVPVRSR